jgi:oligosaccharyltransferase complex subunit epsilon
MSTLSGVVGKFLNEYASNTPKKLKIIDAYLAYVLFTGIFQVKDYQSRIMYIVQASV